MTLSVLYRIHSSIHAHWSAWLRHRTKLVSAPGSCNLDSGLMVPMEEPTFRDRAGGPLSRQHSVSTPVQGEALDHSCAPVMH